MSYSLDPKITLGSFRSEDLSGLSFPLTPHDARAAQAWNDVAEKRVRYLGPDSEGPAVVGLIQELREAARRLQNSGFSASDAKPFLEAVEKIPEGTSKYTAEVYAAVEELQTWQLDRGPDGIYIKEASEISNRDGLAGSKTAGTLQYIGSPEFLAEQTRLMRASFPPLPSTTASLSFSDLSLDEEPQHVPAAPQERRQEEIATRVLPDAREVTRLTEEGQAALEEAISTRQYPRLGSSGPAAEHVIRLLHNLADRSANDPAARAFLESMDKVTATATITANVAEAAGAFQSYYQGRRQIVAKLHESFPDKLGKMPEMPEASSPDKVIGPMTYASMLYELEDSSTRFTDYVMNEVPFVSQVHLPGDHNWRTACYRAIARAQLQDGREGFPPGVGHGTEFVSERDGSLVVENPSFLRREMDNLSLALRSGRTAAVWVHHRDGQTSLSKHGRFTTPDHVVHAKGLIEYGGHEFMVANDPSTQHERRGAFRLFAMNELGTWESPGSYSAKHIIDRPLTATMMIYPESTVAWLEQQEEVQVAMSNGFAF